MTLTLVNQTIKTEDENLDFQKNPFEYIQEGVSHEELEKIYKEWDGKKITTDEELKVAKSQKNALVKIRTGVEARRKEISVPVNNALKKLKAHSDGLQAMSTQVENVVNASILEYEKELADKLEAEFQARKKIVDDACLEITKEFATIKTIDDCNYLLDQAKELDTSLETHGEDLFEYALDKKNEILGKLNYAKIEIFEKKEKADKAEIERLNKEIEDNKAKEEKAEIVVEDLHLTSKEVVVPVVENNIEKAVVTVTNSILFSMWQNKHFESYNVEINKLPKNKIYEYLTYVAENSHLGTYQILSLIKDIV